jgi:hypothetical protein
MRELIFTLADEVDTARAADPDEARRLLWSIARRYGKATALDVAQELWERTKCWRDTPTLLRS